jgi:hypothetical protein
MIGEAFGKLGLPGWFGSIDTTLIPLDLMPKENHKVGSSHASDF